MKLLLSILIAASAIFTAQAQRPAPHSATDIQFKKMTVDWILALTGKLDSLYRFVHTDRPATVTVSEMLIFKTRIMQYIQDREKRDDAKIANLQKRIDFLENINRVDRGDDFQGADHQMAHDFYPLPPGGEWRFPKDSWSTDSLGAIRLLNPDSSIKGTLIPGRNISILYGVDSSMIIHEMVDTSIYQIRPGKILPKKKSK